MRKLAEGADILIYDAQYLPEEYEARRRGWGHSHWREAINVVMESGAKELILYHHDPDHTDAIVDKVVTDARSYYPKVRAAAEGMEIELEANHQKKAAKLPSGNPESVARRSGFSSFQFTSYPPMRNPQLRMEFLLEIRESVRPIIDAHSRTAYQ